MDAVRPLPPETRETALAVIARTLKVEPPLSKPLAQYGDLATVQVLLALEEAFGIPLDVDEVLPDLSIAGLLILVQSRLMTGPRVGGQLPCRLYEMAAYKAAAAINDNARPRPQAVYLPPYLPQHPQQAAAERARRARLVRQGLLSSILAGAFAALVFWLVTP